MDAGIERPELGEWVERRDETCRGGRRLTLLVNRRDGHAVELADGEIELLERLDGTRTRSELCMDDATRETIDGLDQGGFLRATADADEHPARVGAARRARKFLDSLEIEWREADRFVQYAYRRVLHHAFRPAAVVGQFVLAAAGFAALVAAVGSGRRLQLRADSGHIPVVLVMGLVAVAVHELAHALVVAHNGRRVRSIGFRLHLGTPAFFVDSVEALLLPRRQRLIQAAAGPWAEWLVTSVIALMLWVLPVSGFTPLLYRFVILNAMTVTSNLLPFAGLDGHWLLADAIREPDLARRCRGSIGRLATQLAARRPVRREDVALAAYTTLNTVVAGALVATAAFFWWELFGDLVGHLARGGPVGWAVLIALGVLLGRPLVIGLAPQVTLGLGTIAGLADRARFRAERAWRIDATEHLAHQSIFRDLDDRSLSMIAGGLCGRRTIRCTQRLDPTFTGYAVVGPARRSRRPATVHSIEASRADPTVRCRRGGYLAIIDHDALAMALGPR